MIPVARLQDVSVRRGSSWLLSGVSVTVHEGERWVVLGPNGAGKTTMMRVMAGHLFPTSGTVELLGERAGDVPMAELRMRIGWASSTVGGDIPAPESVHDVVLTGAYAVTGRWREAYDAQDVDRATGLLLEWGLADLAGRTFGTLSEGERKRALIARSLMSDPELLLLDEPGAGLDLGGREDLVARLQTLARDAAAPTTVLVTHHVEEIPDGFTHALLMAGGAIVASGPVAEVIADEPLSRAFGQPLTVRREDGRWSARRLARPEEHRR